MKTIIKLSVVLAVLFTSVNSYAVGGNDELNVHVIKNEGKLISFGLNKVQHATVSIYEADETLVYSEKINGSKEGILRTFNLDEFPAGSYTLVVENNNKKVIHEITVTSDTCSISREAVVEAYKDNFKAEKSSIASR